MIIFSSKLLFWKSNILKIRLGNFIIARVDIAGTWSDTPPICYEHIGNVVMLAIVIEQKVLLQNY